MKKLILGIAGTFASGQDSVGKYLAEKYGYLYASTSDMVREEAMKRYGSIERPVLVRTATELRQEQGGGVLAELALQKFNNGSYNGVAITGVRSLGEAKAVKQAGGIIVFCDAPIEMRFERMKARGRDAEINVTLEEFKQREELEAKAGDTDADFNREAIRQMADYHISNVGALEDFHAKVEDLLAKVR